MKADQEKEMIEIMYSIMKSLSRIANALDESEGECDKCANSYELSSRDNRCGDCGNCGNCCTHTAGEGK